VVSGDINDHWSSVNGKWKMEQPLHSCITKAVIADGDQLRTGPKWITSRRGLLKLYPDRLECGNWTVVYSEIREAVLSSFRSPILRIPGYVLAVRTDKETYHFGLNGWAYWKGELPFPVTREQARLRMSAISILARVVLIGFAIYFMWNWIANR
jgi:hypothetical protein